MLKIAAALLVAAVLLVVPFGRLVATGMMSVSNPTFVTGCLSVVLGLVLVVGLRMEARRW